jgi:hypothetical protein
MVSSVACATPDDSPAGPPLVRDSAGVVIVENRIAPGDAPEWALSPQPELSIGVAQGALEYQLHRVGGVATLDDGAVALVNAGTGEVRIFEPDGSFRLAMGRSGEGPGEFGSPGALQARGDRLFVWDARPDLNLGPPRLTVFTTDGELVTTARFEAVASTLSAPSLRFVYPDGSLLVRRDEQEYPPSGYRQLYLSLWRMNAEGEVLDSLPREPLQRMGLLELTRGGRSLQPMGFAPRTHVAGDDGGYWVGTAERHEIRHHGASGALERIVRWRGPELAVPSEAVRVARQGAGDFFADVDAMEFSETFPAYETIFVDRTGAVWVQTYRTAGDTPAATEWLVFDPEGRLAGRATLPAQPFPPMPFLREIGEDYVLGVTHDELGVQRVVRYGLQRRE